MKRSAPSDSRVTVRSKKPQSINLLQFFQSPLTGNNRFVRFVFCLVTEPLLVCSNVSISVGNCGPSGAGMDDGPVQSNPE